MDLYELLNGFRSNEELIQAIERKKFYEKLTRKINKEVKSNEKIQMEQKQIQEEYSNNSK